MVKAVIKKIIKALRIDKLKLYKDIMEKKRDRQEKDRREAFKKYGQECLERTKKALDNINVEFWLDYGTLLGAVREKDFIEHDLDLDIGMFYKDRSDEVVKALSREGLKKVREFRADGKVVEETYTFKGADIDIFYYFYDEKQLWCYYFYYNNIKDINSIDRDDKIYTLGWKGKKTTFTNRGLSKLKFKEIEYTVPNETEKYLIENYGQDYMIKQKNWDYVNSQKNVTDIKFKEIVCIEEKVQ